MTFESRSMSVSGPKKYQLTGVLTIRGVSKPAVFEVESLGSAKDPWGVNRTGFKATSKIDRKDYGMVWNKVLDTGGLMVGDQVLIELDIESLKTSK